MAPKVAINGYGRIGKLVLRAMDEQGLMENLEVIVDVNASAETLAYRTKYDSVHGRFPGEVYADEFGYFSVGGHPVDCLKAPSSPDLLPWKKLGIDYVIEATGRFTSLEQASLHIKAGAKKVIITAPGKGDVPMFVPGVNDYLYNPDEDHVISLASCTTNCLAPLIQVLLVGGIGLESGLMSTIHSYTATQPTVDGPGGRAATLNIIPASTGAAKAVGIVIPDVKGKLTGMAFRVPTPDVSVVDLVFRSGRDTSIEEIDELMHFASDTYLKGILEYSKDKLVSSDLIGSKASSIYDSKTTLQNNLPSESRLFKIVSWYDNEWGYANRVVDMLKNMIEKE